MQILSRISMDGPELLRPFIEAEITLDGGSSGVEIPFYDFTLGRRGCVAEQSCGMDVMARHPLPSDRHNGLT